MRSTCSPEEIHNRCVGPVGSIRTPFTSNGDIDVRSLQRMVDFVVDAGSPAVMLTYGDSLYSILTDAEVADVTRLVADRVAGRAIVIAADRGWWTGKAIEFGQYARGVGADILMLMPPTWCESVTIESLADHYCAVAEHIPVMVVTNVFAGMGRRAMLETVDLAMRRAPNVVAAKDDLCDEFGRRLSMLAYGRLTVIAGGQKQNHLNAWPYGCDAYLSAFITFRPSIARAYWTAIQRTDIATARRIIASIDIPFFDYIMKLPGGFDAGMHGVLELHGLAERWRRPPYVALNSAEMERLADFMHSIEAITVGGPDEDLA